MLNWYCQPRKAARLSRQRRTRIRSHRATTVVSNSNTSSTKNSSVKAVTANLVGRYGATVLPRTASNTTTGSAGLCPLSRRLLTSPSPISPAHRRRFGIPCLRRPWAFRRSLFRRKCTNGTFIPAFFLPHPNTRHQLCNKTLHNRLLPRREIGAMACLGVLRFACFRLTAHSSRPKQFDHRVAIDWVLGFVFAPAFVFST